MRIRVGWGLVGGIALLVAASGCIAQETPTERDAARGVVKQIGELSQTLGVPSMVTKL